MSDAVRAHEGPQIGTLHEVAATFDASDAMQDAVSRLEMSGFDRADLSLPETVPEAEPATLAASAKPVDTDEDARQARILHASGAGAAAGMAAAGVVIATGGALAPAAIAAVVGGGLAGGIAHALSRASSDSEQVDRDRKAMTGDLVLSVRAPTPERRNEAMSILRAAGAKHIEAR